MHKYAYRQIDVKTLQRVLVAHKPIHEIFCLHFMWRAKLLKKIFKPKQMCIEQKVRKRIL